MDKLIMITMTLVIMVTVASAFEVLSIDTQKNVEVILNRK